MNRNNFFYKKDLLIIILILILSVLIFVLYTFFTKSETTTAQILYKGEIIKELPLNIDAEYALPSNNNVIIEVKSEKIHFKHSDCPDKVCVNTGWLSRSGQTAVCLPNKTSVIIKPNKNQKNTVDTEI